jgi:hypothetical protein
MACWLAIHVDLHIRLVFQTVGEDLLLVLSWLVFGSIIWLFTNLMIWLVNWPLVLLNHLKSLTIFLLVFLNHLVLVVTISSRTTHAFVLVLSFIKTWFWDIFEMTLKLLVVSWLVVNRFWLQIWTSWTTYFPDITRVGLLWIWSFRSHWRHLIAHAFNHL